MYKGLEVRVADGPVSGWKVVLMVADGQGPVKSSFLGIANLAINQ